VGQLRCGAAGRGPLVYTNAKRVATAKVNYKPKMDALGHLIAHSFRRPSELTENYGQDKVINTFSIHDFEPISRPAWTGAIEGYIWTRHSDERRDHGGEEGVADAPLEGARRFFGVLPSGDLAVVVAGAPEQLAVHP